MAAAVICSSRCWVSVMKVLMLSGMMKGTLYNTVRWYCAVLRITFTNIKFSKVIVNYGTMKVHYLQTD